MQFICNKIENVHGNYLYIVKYGNLSLMTSVYIVRIIYTCTDANQGMACSQPYQRTSYADKLRPVI